MSVGPKLRFLVFSRDGFRCRYCGRRPPEVNLEIDHLKCKSDGGSDSAENLVTACVECNQGKADSVLPHALMVEFSEHPDPGERLNEIVYRDNWTPKGRIQ